jgi:hypothetical protein
MRRATGFATLRSTPRETRTPTNLGRLVGSSLVRCAQAFASYGSLSDSVLCVDPNKNTDLLPARVQTPVLVVTYEESKQSTIMADAMGGGMQSTSDQVKQIVSGLALRVPCGTGSTDVAVTSWALISDHYRDGGTRDRS